MVKAEAETMARAQARNSCKDSDLDGCWVVIVMEKGMFSRKRLWKFERMFKLNGMEDSSFKTYKTLISLSCSVCVPSPLPGQFLLS
jgi:hypothetical protein